VRKHDIGRLDERDAAGKWEEAACTSLVGEPFSYEDGMGSFHLILCRPGL
jgi:hypothetical protein